jgi:hypothetical protein
MVNLKEVVDLAYLKAHYFANFKEDTNFELVSPRRLLNID